jgi:hypothetical protein
MVFTLALGLIIMKTFGYASLFFKFGLFEVDWLVSSKVQGKLNGRQLM